MRLATYNVENVARRARVLNVESWNDGRAIVEAHAELVRLAARDTYDDDARKRMRDMLVALGLEKTRRSRFVTLVEQRSELAGVSALRGLRVTARGRADWLGWFEFETELLPPRATLNLGQVVRDVGADVLALQEVETRAALAALTRDTVRDAGGEPYDQLAYFAGNDELGLGVGLAARRGHSIGWSRSHADAVAPTGGLIHDRDAPEISVWTPTGVVLWVVVVHFRSSAYGRREDAEARRRAQASAVAASYQRLVKEGGRYIAVCGDFGDAPDSEALSPLVRGTDLVDASRHPTFASDGFGGTYGKATAKERIDHILLSPDLYARVQGGGMWRRGAWGSGKLPAWDVYPELKSSYDGASDHAAVWVDLDL
jgi:endonuclease/exonuclease/phosphatase family metal-dependent hydrolase